MCHAVLSDLFNVLSFTDMKTKVHGNEQPGSSTVAEGVGGHAGPSDPLRACGSGLLSPAGRPFFSGVQMAPCLITILARYDPVRQFHEKVVPRNCKNPLAPGVYTALAQPAHSGHGDSHSI